MNTSVLWGNSKAIGDVGAGGYFLYKICMTIKYMVWFLSEMFYKRSP